MISQFGQTDFFNRIGHKQTFKHELLPARSGQSNTGTVAHCLID